MATLVDLVVRAEATFAGRVAVKSDGRSLTFAEVADRSARAANLLRALHGPGPGTVSLLIGNRLEAVELDVALIKAGLGRVSLNPRLADDEISYIVRSSGARTLVCSPDHAHFAHELQRDIDGLRCVVLDGGIGPGLPYEAELQRASSTVATRAPDDDDPSLIMYTSGTTGRPKGAVWTFRSRRAAVRNMLLNELDRRAAAVMLHVGSMSHGSGSKVVPVYLRGGRNVIADRFDPERFLRTAAEEGVTATFVVPTMVQMLVDGAPALRQPLPQLRHVSYGGAKMPLPTIEAALDRFGSIFLQVYGSCEAPHPILLLDQAAHATRDPRVLSTAGLPSIGLDVRIGPNAQDARPGAMGELVVRGDSIFTGYWNDVDATRAVVDDGYFHTGDVVRVHDDGLVEVIDRVKDMIISGGFNVYPAEVERVLLEHPRVAQASVYGLPDKRWGETVAAAVVLTSGPAIDGDELAAFCGERLAGYKKPRTFLFADAFPIGSTGKVLTKELKQRHEQSLCA